MNGVRSYFDIQNEHTPFTSYPLPTYTSAGNSASGSNSSFSSQASEDYSQGWSSQYTVLSLLAATGLVTTVTTASASGSASGSHSYSSSGAASTWSQTGNYAAGNGTSSGTSASSGTSLTESMQSQWQEGYVITAGPPGRQRRRRLGQQPGERHASSFSAAAACRVGHQRFGIFSASGQAGGPASRPGPLQRPVHLVRAVEPGVDVGLIGVGNDDRSRLGKETNAWSTRLVVAKVRSGSGSGSGTSTSTSGSVSSSYNQDVGYTGFYQGAGFSGMGAGTDGGWRWGVGWAGAGPNGPLGLSAFSSVGYVFAQGDRLGRRHKRPVRHGRGDGVAPGAGQ